MGWADFCDQPIHHSPINQDSGKQIAVGSTVQVSSTGNDEYQLLMPIGTRNTFTAEAGQFVKVYLTPL